MIRKIGFFAILMLWLGAGYLTLNGNLAHAGPPNFVGDVHVRQLPQMTTTTNIHGYREYQFEVKNTSTSQTRKVRLRLAGGYTGGHSVREISRTVSVGPSSQSVVSLFQPTLNLTSAELYISVDDGKFTGTIGVQGGHHYYSYYRRRSVEILTDRLTAANTYNCDGKLSKAATVNAGLRRYRRYKFYCRVADVPVAQWSKNWLGYTRFDGVLVTAAQLKGAPSAVTSAIQRYVEAGGQLTVLGSWTPPSTWRVLSNYSLNSLQYVAGFGTALVFQTRSKMDDLKGSDFTTVADESVATLKPYQSPMDPAQANRKLPVISDIKIPVRGIFMLMLLFSILIGPLNVWWLSRKKRRIMMLVTVPVASIAMCLLVFGYSLFSEGVRGHSITSSVTILDQRSHQATTIGWKAFYLPLAPSAGFQFQSNVELTPQLRFYSYRGGGRSVSMDWSKGQTLGAGWVASRLPIHFRYRSHQNRRERLVIKTTAKGGIRVTNGLGVKIKTLYVANSKGVVYGTQTPIAPGAKRTLNLQGDSKFDSAIVKSRSGMFLRKAYANDWLNFIQKLSSEPANYMQVNSYIAEVEKNPFVEKALSNLQSEKFLDVIVGYFKGGNHGS